MDGSPILGGVLRQHAAILAGLQLALMLILAYSAYLLHVLHSSKLPHHCSFLSIWLATRHEPCCYQQRRQC